MKIQLTILTILLFILNSACLAQPPQAISYQTVVRDPVGLTLANQTVGLQVNIRENTVTGAVVYSENHFPTTNTFGLVNLEIGNGNVNSGQFDGIDWGATDYFIELALDISGGTNFEIMGVSQILSVPYSLYSKKAKEIEVVTSTGLQLSPNGDTLSVEYENPVWNANSIMDGNVSNQAPQPGQVLQWDGTNWIPVTLPTNNANNNSNSLIYTIDGF